MCVDVIIHHYSLYIKSGVFTHKWADVHLHALNKWENVLSTMYNVYVSSLLLSEWGYNEAQFQHVPTMFRMTNTFLNTKLTDIAFNRGGKSDNGAILEVRIRWNTFINICNKICNSSLCTVILIKNIYTSYHYRT